MRRPLAALAVVLAMLPRPASAQRVAVAAGRPADPRRTEQPSFRTLLGIPVAQRLIQSEDPVARVRGVERLGAIGTPEAYEALVETVEQSSLAMRDLRVRLTAVRVLAGETKRDSVRALMMREVTDTTGLDGRGVVSPLAGLLRGTAALALARGGERKGLVGLAAVLLQPGVAADAATRALRAAPAASLDAFLDGRNRLSAPLATFLGENGDLRAIERLRAFLHEGDANGKMAAAVALARLGDDAALPVAREWVGKNDPKLRLAAAEALVALDAPEATEAVTGLLEAEATREDGLRFARLAPAAALAKPLAHVLDALSGEARGRAIAAIGRARGVSELVPLLDKTETETAAAFALATMPGDAARRALEKALGEERAKKGDARRLLVRAATVRALSLDDAPSGLTAALRALVKEQAPADRAAGIFGLVALGTISLRDALETACDGTRCDAVLAGAAARGALALPDGASSLEPLLPWLTRAAAATDPRDRASGKPAIDDALAVVAGVALLAHPDGGELPTQVLAAWAEAGGPLSPLAARALPARDDEAMRGRIKRLLEGTDPVVRAHVAIGLGRDPEPSAVTLLTQAYRFEEDAGVRRAIVRGLSMRSPAEVQRVATLTLARELDPDDGVRALARAALEGRDEEPRLAPALGVEPRRSVAWITLQPSEGRGAARDALPRAARVVRSDGLAVPVLADPDGVMLVPGLPPGLGSLLLARP
jgi:HEAT repeat protein